MPRKQLKTKSALPAKRIKLKKQTTNNISNLFDLNSPLYYSNFALTDDYDVVLFFIDDQFIQKNNLTNIINEFSLNENDLQINFDNQRFLKPRMVSDYYMFDDIGTVKKEKIDWIVAHYPNCIFHPVTKWFGKSVNTLLIVLIESFGKVVGVVKTHN